MEKLLRSILGVALVITMVVGLSCMSFAEEVPTAELPVLMVSAGQSPGMFVGTALANRIKLPYDAGDVPKAEDVARGVGLGDLVDGPGIHIIRQSEAAVGTPYSTIIFIMGASLKGMGASGLSIDSEIARLQGIIDFCNQSDVFIVGMHVEGKTRRGKPGSDNEMIIDAIAPHCDYLIVTSAGNFDGRFDEIAKEKNIPLSLVEKTTDISELMKTLFQVN